MDIKNTVLGVLGLAAVGLFMSAYTVDQRERAILFQFRQIVNADIQPGLHFKLPFMNTVS